MTHPFLSSRALKAWCCALSTAVLAACGGGGDTPPPPTAAPPTGGETAATVENVSGTITGFGSVILNGRRYDDRSVAVSLDRGPGTPQPGTLGDLKIGMNVEGKVVGGALTEVVVRARLEGPIGAVDTTAGTFTVMGQLVKVDGTGATPTMFEGAATLADLRAGDRVEVHGTVDAAKAIVASRVERKPAGETAGGVRVAGLVSGLDPASRTYRINDLTVAYADATIEPAGQSPANGQLVVALGDTLPSGGRFTARALRIVAAQDGQRAAVGGRITAFTSASDFTVGAQRVDASAATFDGGTAADLAVGIAVRVEGAVTDQVLKATKVAVIKTSTDALSSLKGAVSDFASVSSFKLRGTPVDASKASFKGGTAADLGNGSWIVAEGRAQGDMFVASSVEFKTPPAAQPVKLSGELRDWSATARSFRLMGMPARLGERVEFEGIGLAQLADGVRIEATGTPDAQGVVVVVKVKFLGVLVAPKAVVAGGRIGDVGTGSFKLPGLQVTWDSATTFIGGTSADLATGALVLAKGTFDPARRSIAASWIEVVKTDLNVPRIAGPVSEFVSPGDFRVGSQRVDASRATVVDGTAADLGNGVLIAAKGSVSEVGGVRTLVATQVRILQK